MLDRTLISETGISKLSNHRTALLGLIPGILTGGCLITVYLFTHPQPTQAGGLFLEMAEQLRHNNFIPFHSVPNYTVDGVPFAYPPLGIYLVALLEFGGVPPLTIVRVLPAILFLISVVPTYIFSLKVFSSIKHATVIGIVYASTPYILNAHFVAQGTTRSLGLIFLMAGLVTGISIFRDNKKNRRFVAALLFGLTLLSHPYSALFFVLSFLLLYFYFARDIDGLINGIYVGVGGAVIASPYLIFVSVSHGIEAFLYASGHGSPSILSYSGLLLALRHIVLVGPTAVDAVFLWKLFAVGGIILLLAEGRYFLPVWFISAVLFIGSGRFIYLIAAFFSGAFIAEGIYPVFVEQSNISPSIVNKIPSSQLISSKQTISALLVAIICVYAVVHSAVFVMGYPSPYTQEDRFQQFYDDEDREAMRWVSDNTPPEAQFLIQGQVAEWFPYFTNRTSVATPQGTEWVSNSGQVAKTHRSFKTCSNIQCINSTINYYEQEFNHSVDYLYIEKGEYVVGHRYVQQSENISKTINKSSKYEIVFENRGVIIVKVV